MSRLQLLLVASLFFGAHLVRATEDVTSVTLNTTSGSPSTSEGYNFNNDTSSITSFTTATNTYGIASAANNVFVRRNGVNNNQSSDWYTGSGVGTDLSGIHQNDYGQLLLANNVYSGSDNTFANGTDPTTGNIERIDFTWNSAITVNNSLAFAVFERGVANAHDAFAIAAVTAVDGLGNPTAYSSLLVVSAGWSSGGNAIADFTYRLFRYNNGDNLTATTDSTSTGTQGLGGIIITAADLGLANGTTIYGYSLMASDVTAGSSSDLLDWTNATFFPTTTDGNTGGNGLDLASVNGLLLGVVPEPAPSAGLLGTFLLLVSLAHRARTRRAARS